MRILWKRLPANLKNILWKTVYGVITQFMLFQEYTTAKRSTVLSTSSEKFNSDLIFLQECKREHVKVQCL